MKEKNLIPFKPGQSGNPSGRPLGSRNRKSLLLDAIKSVSKDPDKEIQDLILVGLEQAKRGNPIFWKMIVDMVYPEEKGSGSNGIHPEELSDKELRDGFALYKEEMVLRGLYIDQVIVQVVSGEMDTGEG